MISISINEIVVILDEDTKVIGHGDIDYRALYEESQRKIVKLTERFCKQVIKLTIDYDMLKVDHKTSKTDTKK